MCLPIVLQHDNTPLDIAIKHGHHEIVEILGGVDVSVDVDEDIAEDSGPQLPPEGEAGGVDVAVDVDEDIAEDSGPQLPPEGEAGGGSRLKKIVSGALRYVVKAVSFRNLNLVSVCNLRYSETSLIRISETIQDTYSGPTLIP